MNTPPAQALPRRLWLLGALIALLLTSACSDIRDAISGDESTPTSEATLPPPEPTPLATHYIGNTGGLGVSLRSDCATDARIGNAWPETTEVQLLQLGEGRCEGWSLAQVDGVTSWVSQRYLLSEGPGSVALPASVPSIASAPAPPAGLSGDATAPSPSPTPVAPSTFAAAPIPPMYLYGPAAQDDAVLILIDGQPCITATPIPEPAAATGYLWSTQISAGQCDALTGSLITFALNGAPTNQQLEWVAGGTPPNAATGVVLTLR